jgi:hypothetical protein
MIAARLPSLRSDQQNCRSIAWRKFRHRGGWPHSSQAGVLDQPDIDRGAGKTRWPAILCDDDFAIEHAASWQRSKSSPTRTFPTVKVA